jgi:hypothetical protein
MMGELGTYLAGFTVVTFSGPIGAFGFTRTLFAGMPTFT